MAKHEKFIKLHKMAFLSLLFVVTVITIPPLIGTSFIVSYYERIYPQVFVNGVNIGGFTRAQAQTVLQQSTILPDQLQITIHSSTGTKTIPLKTQSIGAQFGIQNDVESAYEVGRQGNVVADALSIVRALKHTTAVPLQIEFSEPAFTIAMNSLSEGLGNPPSYARFVLKNAQVQVINGVAGDELPIEYVKEQISSALSKREYNIELQTKVVDTKLTDSEIQNSIERANALLNKSILLTVDNEPVQTLKIDKLIPFLHPSGGYSEPALRSFSADIAKENNKEVTEAVFKFDGKRVQEFTPGGNGVSVNQELLYQNLSIAISSLERTADTQVSLEVPHESTKPQTSVSDVNNLGIKELIGRGTSRFTGSISSRVYNVALASSRINGVLVAPNETFSFATAIGDISKYTGYKEAYIIQNGKTILGDGGGVCQVSTTLFRAVMNAGLPIIERHAHAYRVGYYEQDSGPGLDATVFVPSVDFKFLNDTGHYILIQTSVNTKNLTADFKIYGTSDGRKATVTKPVVTDQIAPADDLYVDEPTLPLGKIVQLEHRAWGARVSFAYTVERDGKQIYQKNFVSVYQPWQAVYQRGVGPS